MLDACKCTGSFEARSWKYNLPYYIDPARSKSASVIKGVSVAPKVSPVLSELTARIATRVVKASVQRKRFREG
jgi:hypothetical protein